MLKEKELNLKSKLKNIIRENGYDKIIKQDIISEFKSRNLNSTNASLAFSERLDLDTLDDSEDNIRFLFLFSFALNKALKNKGKKDLENFDVSFFTKVEISQWENYREENVEENIFPYMFKNVEEIIPGVCWQTKLSAQEVERLNKADALIYNPNSQRGLKKTKKRFGIDEDPNKVKEIADRIVKGKQFPDDLKFNILKGEGQKPIYNPKSRTLTLREDTVINIFDGQHRKSANSLALSDFPDLEFMWPIKITNLSEIEAHGVMVQINKQKPIKEDVLKIKDYDQPENLVLDKIMDSRGDLANAATNTDNFVKNNMGLVTKAILAEAIKDNYKDQLVTDMDKSDVANWIVEFTRRLMGTYPKEFVEETRYEIKKYSYINNPNMFYGYIALSAVLKDNKNWIEILKQKMNSTDFNKSNSLWEKIGVTGETKATKNVKDNIYLYFREV